MTTQVDWGPLAERLAAELEADDHLRDPALRQAFAEVPRHLFVPVFYRGSEQHPVDHTDPRWLDTIYSNDALSIQYRPRLDGSGLEVSSSTTLPSLMADMIAELDIRPGMRVLEIGTGTGYNAAILCHLLGAENVATIDIDPELMDAARGRLADLGYRPAFTALVDDRNENASVSATGKLVAARGGFMGARRTPEFVDAGPIGGDANWELLRERHSDLPRDVLDEEDFGFFLSWHVPRIEWFHLGNHTNVQAPGGRHADIQDDGTVAYVLFGDMWAAVEQAHQAWGNASRPRIEDWTLLVTDDGRTTLAETMDLEIE